MSKPGQLSIELTNLAASDDKLILTIPKIYLSTNTTSSFEDLAVLADGKKVSQDVFVADNEIGITIPLQSQTKKIELTL
jgi:hypothetical protein